MASLCNMLVNLAKLFPLLDVSLMFFENCDKKYIGETSRNLKTRMKEHQRDVQQGKELS